MGLIGRVSTVVAFLRAGYPNGAPAFGYVTLLALLPRRISDDEVTTITGKLVARKHRSIDNAEVGVEITRVTDEMPSLDDIRRVRDRLDAIGPAGEHHR
jgi:Protein of unknown function (DUF3349)